MSIEPLEQAIASTKAILKEVRPEQLTVQSPCQSWKVSDVINHVVGGQYFFGGAMRGEQPSGESPDFASGDFVDSFEKSSSATLDAFRADGAM
jgi:Mycothiol maleylpyruvate isomerase N-terminal domain